MVASTLQLFKVNQKKNRCLSALKRIRVDAASYFFMFHKTFQLMSIVVRWKGLVKLSLIWAKTKIVLKINEL